MENTNPNNLKITDSYCKVCLLERDELVRLYHVKYKKGNHLHCLFCFTYYCINCLQKESMDKSKFPRCYSCYHKRKNLFKNELELESKPKCKFINCPNSVKIKGYCMRHYKRLYYVNKLQKPGVKKRRSYTRKKFPKPQLLNRNTQKDMSIDNVKKDNS